MQGIRSNGRRIGIELIYLFLFVFLIVIDQVSKNLIDLRMNLYQSINVIPNFFDIHYVQNTGAAWSFLSDVSWGQIFFKILTAVALIAFVFYYLYVCKCGYKFMRVAILFVIAGTIGNFIDRLSLNYVIDFLGFTLFNGYKFPVFNLADTFLTVGLIMAFVHYLFLDENSIFPKKNERKKSQNNN